MITRKLGTILTGCYLVLAASVIAYELSIRIYDRGNSGICRHVVDGGDLAGESLAGLDG